METAAVGMVQGVAADLETQAQAQVAQAVRVGASAMAESRMSMHDSDTRCTASRRMRECTTACSQRRPRRPRQYHAQSSRLAAAVVLVMALVVVAVAKD